MRSARRRHLTILVIAGFVSGTCASLVSQQAPPAPSPPSGGTSDRRGADDKGLTSLIKKIEAGASRWATRDADGNLISLFCPVEWSTDESLILLSTSRTLRSLTFTYRPDLGKPSAEAITTLKNAPGLHSLTLQCGGTIPSRVFAAVTAISQLRDLGLVGVSPEDPLDYGRLSTLVHLRKLTISFPKRLGPAEIASLARAQTLQDLEIHMGQFTEGDSLPLMTHPGLTNLVIDNGNWTVHLTRKSKARP